MRSKSVLNKDKDNKNTNSEIKKKKTFCSPASYSPSGSSPSISWFFSPPPYFVGATHHRLHHRCPNQFLGLISQFAASIESTNLTVDLVLSPQYGFWDCLWMPISVSATGFLCRSGFYHWVLVAWFVLLKTVKDHLSLLGFNLARFLPISIFFLVDYGLSTTECRDTSV